MPTCCWRSDAVATMTASVRRSAGVADGALTDARSAARTGAVGASGGGAPVPAHAFASAAVVATKCSPSFRAHGLASVGTWPTFGISANVARAAAGWRVRGERRGGERGGDRATCGARGVGTGTAGNDQRGHLGQGRPRPGRRGGGGAVGPRDTRAPRLETGVRPGGRGERGE